MSHLNPQPLALKLAAAAQKLRSIREQHAAPAGTQDSDAIAEVATALEELNATHADLRQQNEQLAEMQLDLEAERNRYAALFNFAPDAYLVTDASGIIREANAAAALLLDVRQPWLPGRPLSLYVSPDTLPQFWRRLDALKQQSDERLMWELEFRPRGGQAVPAEARVAAQRDPSGRVTGVWWMIRDVSERRALQARIVEAATAERQRIGQDLHDGLGSMAAAMMLLKSLQRRIEPKLPEESEAFGRLAELLQDTIIETRQLSHGLCPTFLDNADLGAALLHLTKTLQTGPGLEVSLRCPDPCPVESPQSIEQLYRIAQEAAQNAIRHGKASHIRLDVQRLGAQVELRIIDDGVGMPATITAPSGGLGLRLMEQRAALIGGTLDILPSPDGGTVVRCTLPLRNAAPR